MSVKVLIPKQLTHHLGHRSVVDVEAENLQGALEALTRDYELGGVFLNREGELQDVFDIIVGRQWVTSKRSADLRRVPVAGQTVEITTVFAAF